MLFTLLSILTLSPTASFADSGTIASFFSATGGSWGGRGTVTMQNLGHSGGRYEIDVDRATAAAAAGQWNVTTTISGMPGPTSTTLTKFQTAGSDLKVSSTNYTSTALIKTTDAKTLAFSTKHFDNGSGRNVTNAQTLTVLPNGDLHVISDIYQDSTLVEHFDYELTKGR